MKLIFPWLKLHKIEFIFSRVIQILISEDNQRLKDGTLALALQEDPDMNYV